MNQTSDRNKNGSGLMVLEETGKELIEGCQRGESDAFHRLFELYKDRVYTIALRYTNSPAAAEDIAQETFLKLFAGIGTFRGDSGFESWLYRLVVNACFDRRRKYSRLIPMIEGFLASLQSQEESPLGGVLRAELSGQLSRAVEALPPEQRMAVILRYSQDLTYEEISVILGCSAGTVASRLNRAHQTLERRLRRQRV